MALSVDGHNIGNTNGVGALTGSATTGVITAANAGDIVVVMTFAETKNNAGGIPYVSSISDNTGLGLGWAQRKAINYTGGEWNNYSAMELWWAYASSAFSGKTFTANWTGPTSTVLDDLIVAAFAVTGFTGTAYETSPWDATSTESATSTTTSVPTVSSIGTTSSAGILIGATGSANNSVLTNPSGWTALNTFNTNQGQNAACFQNTYLVYSSQQSGVSINWTASINGWASYVDALTIPSAAAPTFRRTLHSTGTRAGSRGMQNREHHRRNPKRDAWLCKNGVWRMAA